jgi:preprotein translocase subunit SecG
MQTLLPVLLVVHLMVAAALVGVVLIQRSEGGALGIGGGGGGFMSGRGAANFLTRLTAYLAAAFFATSIGLTILANQSTRARSIFDAPAATTPGQPSPPTSSGAPAAPATPAGQPARGGILDKLQTPGMGQAPVGPSVPKGQ